MILLLVNGLAALWGGGSLVVDPSGQALGMSTDFLVHSPFVDYAIPGLILFTVLGLGSLLAGIAALLYWQWWPEAFVIEGGVITGWIVIEALMLQVVYPTQLVIAAIGLFGFLTGLAALRQGRTSI